MALLFPLVLRIPAPSGRTFEWIGRFITRMSQFSYSAYLINLPVLSFGAWLIPRLRLDSKPGVVMAILLAYVVIWFSSALVYRKFEKPLTDLRDR
jgi:peptidoglycan/LPS O-acetylase OafA/YrhL